MNRASMRRNGKGPLYFSVIRPRRVDFGVVGDNLPGRNVSGQGLVE